MTPERSLEPSVAPALPAPEIAPLAKIVVLPAREPRRRPNLARVLGVVAALFVLWFYGWTIDANSGFENFGDLDYYQLLVRGWKKGQLHLDYAPKPELLALADPYDPAQNAPYRLGDASLYRNRYYIYFGPAPALTLMLPVSLVAPRDMRSGEAIFVFTAVTFLAISAIFLSIRRRHFPQSSAWTAPAGILIIGFGTHLLALAQRPMFWELAIAAGAAFSALALLACYGALRARRPAWLLAAAGLCLGLAVGSRPTCLFATPGLLVTLIVLWRRSPGSLRWKLALLGAAGLPLAACGAGLMAHNYARFENVFEWGQSYQLSGAYEGKLTHFSLRFLPHNFRTYLFHPLRWTAAFPFAQAEGAPPCNAPGYFGTEEVSGLFATFPAYWFVAGLLLLLRRRQPRRALAARREMLEILAPLAAATLPVMVIVMVYFSTTMRYEADFAAPLALAAMIGMLAIDERTARWSAPPRAAVASAILAASAATVAIGILVSLDYHSRAVQVTSPRRWHELERRANLAWARVGQALGAVDGPRVLKVRFAPRPSGTAETFWQSSDPGAAERILVEHIGESLIRFGFVRAGGAATWGRPLRWDRGHTHTVELQLPSLYRSRGGWWADARRFFAFRERTAVAVWFSGGRALATIVPPLPPTCAAGGAVGGDFSGEVRRNSCRLFRADEVRQGLADPLAKRGGVLSMRIVFSDRLAARGEPVFAAGAHYRSSLLFAEPAEGGGVRLVFENYGQPRAESAVVRPSLEGDVLTVTMASFNPDAFGVEATGDVVGSFNGREILRSNQVAYPSHWGDEQIGYNPFGTTCSPYFTGWILDARWVQPAAR